MAIPKHIFNYRVNFQNQLKKNKYSAKTTQYNGRTYHSKKEAGYAENLHYRLLTHELVEVIPQFKIDLKVNGVHITNYYVDFKVITKNGTVEFHEVKGFETAEWQMKWKLFQALKEEIEPGCELIVIK